MDDVSVVAGLVAQAVLQRGLDLDESDPSLLKPLTSMIRDDEAIPQAPHLRLRNRTLALSRDDTGY